MELISIKNLSFIYPSSDRVILRDISISFDRGQMYLLIGANGEGKSTFVKNILGLVKSTGGFQPTILVEGQMVSDLLSSNLRVSGTIYDEDLSITGQEVLDLVAYFKNIPPEIYEREREKYLELLSVNKTYLQMAVSEYSTGTKQKIRVICALLGDSDLIILDEPMRGLDVGVKSALGYELANLRDLGKTILIISHETVEIEQFIDKNIFLSGGVISKTLDSHEIQNIPWVQEIWSPNLDLNNVLPEVFDKLGIQYQSIEKGYMIFISDQGFIDLKRTYPSILRKYNLVSAFFKHKDIIFKWL